MQTHPQNPDGGGRVELHALTSVRFFAALLVILFHNHAMIGDSEPVWLVRIASGGHHAVSLFFVLSGFILHHTYRRTDWSQPAARRNYFVNRVARIYPVYLLAFLIDAPRAVGVFLTAYDLPTALFKAGVTGTAYLTFTQTWAPRLASAWNAPGWSLSAEVFFYLLFPWIIPRIARLSFPQAVAGLALMLIASSGGLALSRLAIHAAGVSPDLWLPFARVFPPLRIFEFVFGILLGRLFADVGGSRTLSRFGSGAISVVSIIAILLLSNRFTLPWIDQHHALLLPVYGLLILSLALDANPVAQILSMPALRFLGGASYAVYLLHMPLLRYFQEFGVRAGWTDAPTTFLFYCLFVVGVSCAVFHFYEEPLRRLIRRRFAWRPSDPAQQLVPPIPPRDTSRFPPG